MIKEKAEMDKGRFLVIIFLLSEACVNEVLCSCCQDLYVTSNVILPLGVLGKKIVVEERFYLGTSFTLFFVRSSQNLLVSLGFEKEQAGTSAYASDVQARQRGSVVGNSVVLVGTKFACKHIKPLETQPHALDLNSQ